MQNDLMPVLIGVGQVTEKETENVCVGFRWLSLTME